MGSAGVLTLSYFTSCRVETISGGKATVGVDASEVSGGKVDATTQACQETAAITTADATEAGAGVLRVTPFGEDNWQESSIKTTQPIFKWVSETPGVEITIKSVDEESPKEILAYKTDKSFLIYPSDAPILEMGKPYAIRVVTKDTIEIKTVKKAGRTTKETIKEVPLVLGAIFSIDPNLEIDDNVANRTIRLIQK